jgi:hypothetical protein
MKIAVPWQRTSIQLVIHNICYDMHKTRAGGGVRVRFVFSRYYGVNLSTDKSHSDDDHEDIRVQNGKRE